MHIDVFAGRGVLIEDELRKLLGLSFKVMVATVNENIIYKGRYNTDSVNKLHLSCHQMERDHVLLNGKKSDVLAVLPVKEPKAWGEIWSWTFYDPIFLPLNSSTDKLEFKLTDVDGKNFPVENLILSLEIKDG